MIRELRTWHRRWFILLAIVLPILLFVALRGRPMLPIMDDIPAVGATPYSPRAEGAAR